MVLAIAIIAIGAAIQATIGLGLGLFCVPLLGLVDLRFLPGPMLLASMALALGMAYRDRAEVSLRTLGTSLVGLAAGTIAGAILLKAVPGGNLARVFGILILVGVALSVSGFSVQPSPFALVVGGTAAGIMGTMAGVHGPPIALVFQHAGPQRARGMLGGFFAVAYVMSIPALAAVGLLGLPELLLGAALLPGVAVGFLGSFLIARWMDRLTLRIAILGISALSACIMVVRG